MMAEAETQTASRALPESQPVQEMADIAEAGFVVVAFVFDYFGALYLRLVPHDVAGEHEAQGIRLSGQMQGGAEQQQGNYAALDKQ